MVSQQRRTFVDKVQGRLQRHWRYFYYARKGAAYWRQFRGGRILVHHGVTPGQPASFNARFVSAHYLEAQIQFIKRHFHLASITEYLKGEVPEDRYSVVLTFDDGFKNNLEVVLPILEKYQAPA